jgi:hypothetical protein
MGYPVVGYPYLCPYLRIYYLAGIPYILCKYAHTRRCPYMRGCPKKDCMVTNISLNPLHPDQYIQISQTQKNGPHKGGLFPFYPFWKKNIKRQPSFLKNLFGYGKYILKKSVLITSGNTRYVFFNHYYILN